VRAAIAPLATPVVRLEHTRVYYRRRAEAGFVRALLPEAQGGAPLSTLDFALAAEELAAEELAAVDINVPTLLLAIGLGL
jgi:alkylation response protein AidB-like acyl-CoA dehydrogenase